MARWTLEQIELQAVRGGVNREQAEQLVAEVRQLRAQVAILRGDDPFDVFAPAGGTASFPSAPQSPPPFPEGNR